MNPQLEPIPGQDDEEIARIRAVRHRISERFGHDPYRLVAYYIERQQEHQKRLVRAPESDAAGGASGPRPPQDR
jgi:hypothetical protein